MAKLTTLISVPIVFFFFHFCDFICCVWGFTPQSTSCAKSSKGLPMYSENLRKVLRLHAELLGSHVQGKAAFNGFSSATLPEKLSGSTFSEVLREITTDKKSQGMMMMNMKTLDHWLCNIFIYSTFGMLSSYIYFFVLLFCYYFVFIFYTFVIVFGHLN